MGTALSPSEALLQGNIQPALQGWVVLWGLWQDFVSDHVLIVAFKSAMTVPYIIVFLKRNVNEHI